MKRILGGFLLLLCSIGAHAQFANGQVLSAAALNAALAAPTITGGTITGLAVPIPLGSGGTGATTATGATSQLQYLQGATGSVARSLTNKFQDTVSVFDFMTPPQIASVQARDNVQDVTTAVQQAITSAAGKILYFPAGNYKLTAQENILAGLTIACDRGQAQFVLGTPNQNGLVISDGTAGTKSATYNTVIRGCAFIPLPGVTASTSGSAIYANNAAYFDIDGIDVYGQDASTNKIFNGVNTFQGSEYFVRNSKFRYLSGSGVTTSGSAGLSNRTVDGRIDFDEFTNITGDAIYFGANTSGMTVNFPVMYSNSAWGIHVDSPAGPSGQNFFINQPDIEVDNSSNGIYVSQGSTIQVVGGWIGAGTINQKALQVDANGNDVHLIGTEIYGLGVTLSGPANSLDNVQATGDNSTSTTFLTVNSGATDTRVIGGGIKQFITYGINFVGSPTRALVSGVHFKNIGTAEINGQSFAAASLPPIIKASQTDAAYTVTAAASITLHTGREFYQMTGATTVTTMTALGQGVRVTFQAGSGGVTFGSGGNIQLKTAPTTVPAFSTISFISDGQTWFEDGRNF